MTVCLAASCLERKEPQIVLCHDWLASVPTAGSIDTVDKQRFLGNNWMALIAGDVAHAEELVGFLENKIPAVVTANEAVRIVRESIFQYRKILLDQLLLGSCGIPFDTFIKEGQKIYPESVFKDIQREVVDVKLGLELIVTGFTTEKDHEAEGVEEEQYLSACLIQVYERDRGLLEVTIEDSFACIGEGASAAQTSMMFRDHDRFDDLMKTVYRVFEAKTMAELNPSVGTSTSVYLQRPKQQLAYLNGDGFDHFYDLFKEFGPRPVKRKVLKDHPLTTRVFTNDRVKARTEAAKRGLLPDSAEVTKRSRTQTSEDQQ